MQHFNENIIRSILGDYYVDYTISNIDKGDPMAIYKDSPPFLMFVRIFVNNFRVMLMTVALGVLPILGVLIIFSANGFMLGSFMYFFVQKGLFWESFRSVFIHGTVEIISITIAGAASLIISHSILFPGTYPRLTSFTRGVKDAMKVCAGLVPFILLAAIVESYVTRYTGMPDWLAIAIIFSSLALMVYYYIIYPIQLDAKFNKEDQSPILEIKDL